MTHFVAGAGTGGTISGVGKYLKERNDAVQIIAADPANSVYSGGSGRPYLVEGVGEDFWPDTYDPKVVDVTVPISDAESFEMAHRVTVEEGILIGGSGGTAVAAALRVAEGLTPDDLVVGIILRVTLWIIGCYESWVWSLSLKNFAPTFCTANLVLKRKVLRPL